MGVPLADLNGMSLIEWGGIVQAWNDAHASDEDKTLSSDETAQLAAMIDAR